MMSLESLDSLLIEVVKNTDGWVLVVVFVVYIIYHIYKKHVESSDLTRTLKVLEGAVQQSLGNIDRNVRILANRIDVFIGRFPMR